MRIAEISVLFDYLYWVRDRVLAAAEGLADAKFVSTETVTTRDLRATLVHELDVEWSWRLRLRGAPPEAWGPEQELDPTDYPTVAMIAEHSRRDEADMLQWLAGQSDDGLAAPPASEREGGHALWGYLAHVVSHGLQQFSDAAVLLTRAGRSPGQLEFLDYADARLTRQGP